VKVFLGKRKVVETLEESWGLDRSLVKVLRQREVGGDS
jgi:hypothetical protein